MTKLCSPRWTISDFLVVAGAQQFAKDAVPACLEAVGRSDVGIAPGSPEIIHNIGRVPSPIRRSPTARNAVTGRVIQRLDGDVKSRIKPCKISAIRALTRLTLPPPVAIVEEFPGCAARSIGSGRWVVQTRFERDNHTCKIQASSPFYSRLSARFQNARVCNATHVFRRNPQRSDHPNPGIRRCRAARNPAR